MPLTVVRRPNANTSIADLFRRVLALERRRPSSYVPDPSGEPDGKVLVVVDGQAVWGDVDGGGA